MEFIVISESKLKIILTKEDAERIDFETESADYDTAKTRRAFRRILDEANERVGFTSKGEKILIQFYPSRDGGCEIFVTKLALTKEAMRLVECSKNVTTLEPAHALYYFGSIDELRHFARAAIIQGSSSSDSYRAESGACFLDIEFNSKKDKEELFYIREFGTRCPSDLIFYVREHCELHYSGNAIEMLAAEA